MSVAVDLINLKNPAQHDLIPKNTSHIGYIYNGTTVPPALIQCDKTYAINHIGASRQTPERLLLVLVKDTVKEQEEFKLTQLNVVLGDDKPGANDRRMLFLFVALRTLFSPQPDNVTLQRLQQWKQEFLSALKHVMPTNYSKPQKLLDLEEMRLRLQRDADVKKLLPPKTLATLFQWVESNWYDPIVSPTADSNVKQEDKNPLPAAEFHANCFKQVNEPVEIFQL